MSTTQYKGVTYETLEDKGYCLIAKRPNGKRTYRIFFHSNGSVRGVVGNFADHL